MATKVARKREWQDRFLAVYEESCNISLAARACKIDRRTVYRERERNPDFTARMEAAEKVAVANLEEVAYKRAVAQSDTLLIFLLKANRPSKYRESMKVQHGGTVKHEIEEGLDDEIERFLAANDSAGEGQDGRGDSGEALAPGSTSGPESA